MACQSWWIESVSVSSLGFSAIGDSKYTSDVNWGCMLRSSQMLVAQVWCPPFSLSTYYSNSKTCFLMHCLHNVFDNGFLSVQALLFHRLGRSWRKPLHMVRWTV